MPPEKSDDRVEPLEGPVLRWAEVQQLIPELRALARQRLRREHRRTEDLRTTALLDTALKRMFKDDGRWDYERVWESWDDVRRVFRTCMNRAITDHFRRKQRRAWLDLWSPEQFEREVATTPAFYEDAQLSYWLVLVLSRLQERSPRSHDLLEKRLVWGYSTKELLQDVNCGDRQLRRYQVQAWKDLQAAASEVGERDGSRGP